MGVRDWLVRLLHWGEPPQVDPDAVVELCNVPLAEGPMTLASLQRAGIDATGFEATGFDGRGPRADGLDHFRIMVRQCDLVAAQECLESLR